mgnify:CR=1 FL=1
MKFFLKRKMNERCIYPRKKMLFFFYFFHVCFWLLTWLTHYPEECLWLSSSTSSSFGLVDIESIYQNIFSINKFSIGKKLNNNVSVTNKQTTTSFILHHFVHGIHIDDRLLYIYTFSQQKKKEIHTFHHWFIQLL